MIADDFDALPIDTEFIRRVGSFAAESDFKTKV